MNKILPYLLPMVSLISIFFLALSDSGISNLTGFAVRDVDYVTSDIKIVTNPNIVMPIETIIEVRLDERSSTMNLDEFIRRTGKDFLIRDGEFPDLEYVGEGYSGDFTYLLSLEDFGLGVTQNKKDHILTIRVEYNGKTISEQQEIVKS